MRIRLPILSSALVGTLALGGLACMRDRDNTGDTRTDVEETKDKAAEQRSKIQDKSDELGRADGDTSGERAKFAADTEQTLRDLDPKIAELKTSLQERASAAGGEARGDLEQSLRELETARRQAQDALDKFRQGGTPADGQQETASAVERTRAAYDTLHGRVHESAGSMEHVKVEKK